MGLSRPLFAFIFPFSWYIVSLQLIIFYNGKWWKETGMKKEEYAPFYYTLLEKNLTPSENRWTAILNWKKSVPGFEPSLPRHNAIAQPLVPPPLPIFHPYRWSSFLFSVHLGSNRLIRPERMRWSSNPAESSGSGARPPASPSPSSPGRGSTGTRSGSFSRMERWGKVMMTSRVFLNLVISVPVIDTFSGKIWKRLQVSNWLVQRILEFISYSLKNIRRNFVFWNNMLTTNLI